MGMEGLKYISSRSSMGCHLPLCADFPGPNNGQGREWPKNFHGKSSTTVAVSDKKSEPKIPDPQVTDSLMGGERAVRPQGYLLECIQGVHVGSQLLMG